MKLLLGYNAKQEAVHWNSETAINGHMLLIGKTGSGKTHNVKKIVNEYMKEDQITRVHVFDPHSDMEIGDESVVRFSESSNSGINPLKISDNPEFGGVRKRIQTLFDIINSTSRKLGSKQESVLRNILIDLYASKGLYIDSPQSWENNTNYPTMQECLDYSKQLLKTIYIGSSIKSLILVDELSKNARSMIRKNIKFTKQPESTIGETEALKDLQEQGLYSIECFTQYIEHITSGKEKQNQDDSSIDLSLKYGSLDVLKSVVERLENLMGTGLFKSEEPAFNNSKKIWRYDLKPLSNDEKSIYVQLRIKEIYDKILESSHNETIKHVFVVDEAHLYMGDDENIINTLAKESRKFGVSLIAASQSPAHFSADFTGNVGMTMILGTSEIHFEPLARKFRIKATILENIVPRKIIAVSVDQKTQKSTGYKLIASI